MGVLQNIARAFSSTSRPATNPGVWKDAEWQDRLIRYQNSWDAYNATMGDSLVRDSVTNDNVKVNPARAIVDTSVYFLFGTELKFQDSATVAAALGKGEVRQSNSPENSAPENNPEWLQKLNKAWKANEKESFLFGVGKTGAVTGDVFVKILPNAAGLNREFPRVVSLDPATVDVEWDPNDYTKVTKFTIENVAENKDGNPTILIEEIEAVLDKWDEPVSWTIKKFQEDTQHVSGNGFVPITGSRVQVGETIDWNFSWPPIEHCSNVELPHEYWGLPDLDEAAVDVIKSIQNKLSDLNKIVRIHASPRMFAKNVLPDQVDEIDVSSDNIITLPNPDSDLDVLNSLQNITPAVNYINELESKLLKMLQVPPIALGDFESASTSITGVTLSILYAPILQKTELKRIPYGGLVTRLSHKMLYLMGYTDPEEYEGLVLVWPEAIPGAEFLERQTLKDDMALGLSKWTAMTRLGADPEEEEKRRLKELEAEERIKAETKAAPQMEMAEMQVAAQEKQAKAEAAEAEKAAKRAEQSVRDQASSDPASEKQGFQETRGGANNNAPLRSQGGAKPKGTGETA